MSARLVFCLPALRVGLVCWALLGLVPQPAVADELPAGTVLHVRLQQTVASYSAEADDAVSALLIAPVVTSEGTLLPLGTEVLGVVTSARRVGFGFVRERAAIHLTFDAAVLPDGTTIPLEAAVADVDNARESVSDDGVIEGIRASQSFQGFLSGVVSSLGILDPMFLAFTTSTAHSVFRVPESEILLPAGSELELALAAPLEIEGDHGPVAPPLAADDAERAVLTEMLRTLPFRTATETTGEVSDLTNLVFIGSEDAIARAFDAAGWQITDDLDAQSTYGTMRSVVENQGYREAPMSTLLLNGAAPRFTYAKTLNTFFERHHFRVFGAFDPYDGAPVWTASSTRDSGIGFATQARTFIHVIDENIDEERDKIVYDLVLTGCANAVEWVERPWLPEEASNSTGDRLLTDRRAAVVRLNDCLEPARADEELGPMEAVRARPSGAGRFGRNFMLVMRDDVVRGNLFYQVYSLARLGLGALFRGNDGDGPATVTVGGQPFMVVSGAAPSDDEPLAPDNTGLQVPSFAPPPVLPETSYENLIEFSVSGAEPRFARTVFQTQPLLLSAPRPTGPPSTGVIDFETSMSNRYSVTGNVTLNSHRYVSHEFAYTFSRTDLNAVLVHPDVPPVQVTGPAAIRQFNYNALVHLRPRGSRVRPYLAAGPGMQMLFLSEELNSSDPGLVRFAFRDALLVTRLWNFGNEPPLDGGGVFQWTFQYGAGIKVHLSRRWILRADFRETVSQAPDFWTESHDVFNNAELTSVPGATIEALPARLHGPLRHQRLSVGFGIGF